jgi:AcrR family transcriptional regulator
MPEALADDRYDDGPRVGRPRDPRVDDAVRAATLQLLVEDGYQATSIQAIARRAGVSVPAIYRRWSNKAELIEEAVFPAPFIEPTASTGDLRRDIETYCRGIIQHLGDPAVRAAIPGLLTEYQTDPDMWHRLVQRSVTPMREAFATFLATTSRRPIGSVDALFDVLMGALFVRAINSGATGADAFARELAIIVAAALGEAA